MNENQGPVVLRSMDALVAAARQARLAYPASSLPYSKDVIRRAISDHLIELAAGLDGSLAKAEQVRSLYGLYLVLAAFIPDADAAFVNGVWDSYTEQNPTSGDARDLARWERDFTATDDYRRYATLMRTVDAERQAMDTEIKQRAPFLRSLNRLETRSPADQAEAPH